jgi:hypothetical protein
MLDLKGLSAAAAKKRAKELLELKKHMFVARPMAEVHS